MSLLTTFLHLDLNITITPLKKKANTLGSYRLECVSSTNAVIKNNDGLQWKLKNLDNGDEVTYASNATDGLAVRMIISQNLYNVLKVYL